VAIVVLLVHAQTQSADGVRLNVCIYVSLSRRSRLSLRVDEEHNNRHGYAFLHTSDENALRVSFRLGLAGWADIRGTRLVEAIDGSIF